MAKKSVDTKKQTKFFITVKEQRILRLAAAIKNESMAEFCRNVVLQQAHNIVKKFKPPKDS
ncbi:MAG TPA: hypothetical protein DIT97_16050 [Gimesia maris]|uniref:DUF1778 domain-containing protein n=1 Tax=Gimesia maris TaxID=122 RepID=A0A3D3R6N2_9PLAN|nr:hypothetical protein [Gimesia maris]|tara:strand:+ start:60341 stop:60523 length:183 start_codon:yes stop_codon:yes gene_type:complete